MFAEDEASDDSEELNCANYVRYERGKRNPFLF